MCYQQNSLPWAKSQSLWHLELTSPNNLSRYVTYWQTQALQLGHHGRYRGFLDHATSRQALPSKLPPTWKHMLTGWGKKLSDRDLILLWWPFHWAARPSDLMYCYLVLLFSKGLLHTWLHFIEKFSIRLSLKVFLHNWYVKWKSQLCQKNPSCARCIEISASKFKTWGCP